MDVGDHFRPSRKKRWKDAALNYAEKLGVNTIFQYFDRYLGETLYVLIYHRVEEYGLHPYLDPALISAVPAQFDAQMRLITEKYHPVSVEDVLSAIESQAPLPNNPVLVTVDDGYRDFKDVLLPIAKRYGIKPILFIPTAFVGQGLFWWDKLYIAISNCTKDELPTPYGIFPVRTLEEKSQAIGQLRQEVKALPFEQGMQFVNSIYAEHTTKDFNPPSITLTWDELRQLSTEGVTIAAHTHTHPLLSRITFEQACQEIRLSQETICREIGKALPIFAYPDGKPEYIPLELIDFLRTEGFKFAVTTVEGGATLSADTALYFPRIGLWPSHTLAAFHLHLTPFYRLLKGEKAAY